jgi:uncharacterized protein (DUF1697 family)
MTDNYTYIALLRGINVSGQKLIKMEMLRACIEALGFENVQSYIQSGNIVFRTQEETYTALEQKISKAIKETFTFDVSVVVRSVGDWEKVIEAIPYKEEGNSKLYITFLNEIPILENQQKLLACKNEIDDFTILNKEVYILCNVGYGNTQFSNTFVEKKLKVSATTRNLATVLKMRDLATKG